MGYPEEKRETSNCAFKFVETTNVFRVNVIVAHHP